MKRPNHADFMTHSELRDKKWTGVRHNSLTYDYEFWINGIIEKRVTKEMRQMNPRAMEEAHIEVFSL